MLCLWVSGSFGTHTDSCNDASTLRQSTVLSLSLGHPTLGGVITDVFFHGFSLSYWCVLCSSNASLLLHQGLVSLLST